jgi:hypothetical protein
MKIRVYTWREMQTDLANEGMQGVPIEADARAVRPYRSSGFPAWFTTTYNFVSPPQGIGVN